ncbi:ComEC/Rec2 family competence protein [Sphingomonas arenae]|uniref:ComEC/Rec2 family competence protein n=1 Tax=Sphingomonas arenae TaxID=2812555 RepID=UPI0019679618|nr:ComEC/Rec2 family competence protein [Sphingomonas arenae]
MTIAALPQRGAFRLAIDLSAIRTGLEALLEREREQLALWLVVGLASGIAAWLSLPDARSWAAFMLLAAGASLVGWTVIQGRLGSAVGGFALAALFGAGLIWWRSVDVAAPRIKRPVIIAFQARVEAAEPQVARDSIRLTLSPNAADLPPRIRVTVPEKDAPAGLGTGALIQIRARLTPPMAMTLPGDYDFARDAWFKGVGGTGRSLGPVQVLQPAATSGLDAWRARLNDHIRKSAPGPEGGIAAALATGDQGSLPEEDAEAMRRSGLAHLLSVSGLHIAAAVGAAFLLTLRVLALSQRLALRVNLVLVAAGVGAAAGIAYTLLTGAQVPTVCSCVAAVLVLIGLALGREALSMRLVAVGGLAVLLFRPEALGGASFQFSFAAVTTLVALYGAGWFRRWFERREEGFVLRSLRAVGSLLVTGLAIELALMPFALYHFHRAGLYGVAANLLAIPLTTFVIMPLEAGALLLDVVGLGGWLWTAAGWAIGVLLWIAHLVAGASGAVTLLPTMPQWAFALLVLGLAWLWFWASRVRLLGIVPLAVGSLAALSAPRADLLVTGDGRHLAIVAEDGTPFLLRERAGDFMRDTFAESAGFDGELPAVDAAPGSQCSADACVAQIDRAGRTWTVLATRSVQTLDWVELIRACALADIVVSERRLPRGCTPRWLKLDRATLARTGGISIRLASEPVIDSVADRVGQHPWAQNTAIPQANPLATPQVRFRPDR